MTAKEFTKKLENKIMSLTAKDAIMAMVNGLRNPETVIYMNTYGHKKNGICYGCAATNAIIYLMKDECPKPQKFLKDWLDSEKNGFAALFGNFSDAINDFESVIDDLRKGNIDSINDCFEHTTITNPKSIDLPYLTNDYTEDDLKVYEELANSQVDHLVEKN